MICRELCAPGTRTHILAEIRTWVEDASQDSPKVYQWLFGPAGSGKSTIAHTISHFFGRSATGYDVAILGANFFCPRQFEETNQLKYITRTIAYHLALICEPFAHALACVRNFEATNQIYKYKFTICSLNPGTHPRMLAERTHRRHITT